MLVVLPPSEGKLSPDGCEHLALEALSFPTLTPARDAAVRALTALCRDEAAARLALGLGPTRRDEIAQNLLLRRAPVAAAVRVYHGVLYEALDAATLTVDQSRRLDEQVVIASALWGLLRPSDPIPAYRLSAGSKVPGLGPALWRRPVADVLAGQAGPIVDLRSGAYQSLAPLPAGLDAVVGRVLQERGGRRVVVSHHNKAIKGALVRAVAQSRRSMRSVADLVTLAESMGIRAERTPSGRGYDYLDLLTVDAPRNVAN